MGYYQRQIDDVLNAKDNDWYGQYQLKIKGNRVDTNWLNITPTELKKIRRILTRS